MRAMDALLFTAISVIASGSPIRADETSSVIPPVVLQFCAPTAVAHRRTTDTVVANNSVVGQASPAPNSMDLSFVNTATRNIKIVIVRIGDTEVANVGKFSPDVTIKWRIPAMPGPCSVRAVRFEDGTEWSASSAPPAPASSAH
jgi:hypothetical protein